MKVRYIVMLAASLMISGSVFADDTAALFKKNNCTTCHNPDKKTVGPALKDIAAKYKGDAGAQAKLEAKVRKGGAGSFGTMAMPAVPAAVSDADIKTLVSWVLAR
jgi:cytochrome c